MSGVGVRTRRAAAVVLLVLLALVAGCARFPDASSAPWRDNPEIGPEKVPSPQSRHAQLSAPSV